MGIPSLSFFSSLLQALRPAVKRRAAPRRAADLGLERLEDRWTPAIAVLDQGTDHVRVVDSDSGKTNNTIEVIDDLNTLTTYIKINGGPEQRLGQAGKLLTELEVYMGAGDDKVTFSVRKGTEAYDGDQSRFVDLGMGNDTLNINLPTDVYLAGSTKSYRMLGDGSGNDTYNITGEVKNGGLVFDLYTFPENSGNDKYNIDLDANNAAAYIYIVDRLGKDSYKADLFSKYNDLYEVGITVVDDAGDDTYALALGGLDHTSEYDLFIDVEDNAGSDAYDLAIKATSNVDYMYLHTHDYGAGKNKVTFTQFDVSAAEIYVRIHFEDSTSTSAVVKGNATISNDAYMRVGFYSKGNSVDTITIDDNAVASSAYNNFQFDTYGGNDKVTVKIDGKGKSNAPQVDGAQSYIWFEVTLGDGNDEFKATVATNYTISSPEFNTGGAEVFVDAYGEGGNDKLTFDAGGKQLWLKGYATIFETTMDGGDGNDVIDVDLGNVVSTGGSNAARIYLNGGLGADKINLDGYLKGDSAYFTMTVEVSLGQDADKDTLKSTFRPANNVSTPVQATLDFEYRDAVLFRDVIDVSKAPGAPIWIGI